MKRYVARLAVSWSVVLIASVVTPQLARAGGWRLMVPPTLTSETSGVRRDAPMAEWKQLRAFDSAEACEHYPYANRLADLERAWGLKAPQGDYYHFGTWFRDIRERQLELARCVPFELAESSAAVARRARESVVIVETYDAAGQGVSRGTGTVFYDFRKRGYLWIDTSFHVVRDAWSAAVTFADGNRVPVTGVAAEDEAHDLVTLQAPTRAEPTPYLDCAKALPQPGDRVIALGTPEGLGWSVSDGVVAAYRSHPRLGPIVQFTAPISPGSSGGPLLDLAGDVVGYVTMFLTEGQNLNFAVPCETANQMVVLKPPLPLPGRRTAAGTGPRVLPRTPDQSPPSAGPSGPDTVGKGQGGLQEYDFSKWGGQAGNPRK